MKERPKMLMSTYRGTQMAGLFAAVLFALGTLVAAGCSSDVTGEEIVNTPDEPDEEDHGGGHGGGGHGGGGHGGGGHGGGGHGGGGHGGGGHSADGDVDGGEQIFRSYCAACHTMGLGDLARGPDLLVADLRPDGWLRQWIRDPEAMLEWNPYAQNLVAEWGIVMPPSDHLSDQDIDDVITFLHAQRAEGVLEPGDVGELDDVASEEALWLYFGNCAGCHGTVRGGATGPELTPERVATLGADTVGAVIRHGTPWGMPAFGRDQTLSQEEIDRLVAFLHAPVPDAPSFSLDDALETWEVLVEPQARPDAPMHDRDWENFTGVVLRDTGEILFIDGDTHEEVVRLDAGFATHILRMSTTGRYVASVGRDGLVALIDLWMETPAVVARSRGCWDARSVAFSVYGEHADDWLVQGCYWPSQFVVMDGETLEPIAAQDVLGPAVDTGEMLDEVRVAAILPSLYEPVWMLALKESGHVAFVDYSQPGFPVVKRLDAERFLHDGGWDATGRYFLLAANAQDTMVVVDSHERTLEATIPMAAMPHPGRGANWVDPDYGPVNATGHMGAPLVSIYGTDPQDHPEHAWQVVRTVDLPASGSLFLKTHPASPWVIIDMTLAPDPEMARQVCAWHKQQAQLDSCFSVTDHGRVVHPEFNRDGSEIWLSVWHENGEIVVLDAITLQEKHRFTGLPSPTGKFNVFNTAHEIY